MDVSVEVRIPEDTGAVQSPRPNVQGPRSVRHEHPELWTLDFGHHSDPQSQSAIGNPIVTITGTWTGPAYQRFKRLGSHCVGFQQMILTRCLKSSQTLRLCVIGARRRWRIVLGRWNSSMKSMTALRVRSCCS